MDWYLQVVQNYVGFSGRARRKEFWMFVLFNAIIAAVLGIIGSFFNFPYISSLYSLAVLLPSLAVAVRRLHDTNRTGWWIFICLVPVIGGIWLLILYCLDSTPGENKYGPNPKTDEVSAAVAA